MRPTRLEISRNALLANVGVLRQHAPHQRCIAVVKANAYGHGIELVARTIEPAVDMFGVAFAEEGELLRRAGITKPIIVLMTPTEQDIPAILAWRLDVVGCSLAVVKALDRAAHAAGVQASVHVYVDTGMHRDGLLPEKVPAFVEACNKLTNLNLVGICTHFARSDERNCSMTTLQNERFAHVLKTLRARGYTFPLIHAANTAATLYHPATHYTAIRVGIGIYGITPGEFSAPELQPALRLVSCVTALRRIEAGEPVSYGTFYTSSRPTTIATIPLGYGDGFSRMLTGKAECLIRGQRFPIIGAICMDECMVDVGDTPIEIGDEVVLIGQQGKHGISATELAKKLGTIPYEVVTLLSTRIERVLTQ